MTYTGEPCTERQADVVIVGGGVGGCAAALAAAALGRSVVLTEPTDWIGGQLTQQAVPPDEHPWIEQFGSTRRYREFRARVRDFYRRNYPLNGAVAAAWDLNPGRGLVSRLCHEPRAALAALNDMLAPHVSNGLVTVLLDHTLLAAETDADRILSVQMRNEREGTDIVLRAPFILDATELGDLLPLAGVEYVTGAESRLDTGEKHARHEAAPQNQQAFTCCFAMEHRVGEDHTIDRPATYEFWRNYLPESAPAWPGPLLSLTGCDPVTVEPRDYLFDPVAETDDEAAGMWRYRRILARSNFAQGAFASDICLVNWPMNDYWLGNLVDVSPEEALRHVARAKDLSLSLFYWLQTEAPRPDGGTGWPGLRLRPDVVGTTDGIAKHPYIRESRRIRAEFTVLEQHVGLEARMEETGKAREEVEAEPFKDSVGIGCYRIDLHPSSGGDNYIDVSSLPFRIPLGALIPERMENLLPACKNLGVTHVTNGCFRLHPVEWNIGESAGALAAFCLERGVTPRAVRADTALLEEFQKLLTRQGVELQWPRVRPV